MASKMRCALLGWENNNESGDERERGRATRTKKTNSPKIDRKAQLRTAFLHLSGDLVSVDPVYKHALDFLLLGENVKVYV